MYLSVYHFSTTYIVKNGKLTGTLESKGILILYNENYLNLPMPASVKVADGTTANILEETLEVTLNAENAVKATYAINDGEEVEFKDGEAVIIGEEAEESELIELTLRGENTEGTKTCITYIFKKLGKVTVGAKVYFEKPVGWADTINAYVYDETTSASVKENAKWPGISMTREEDGTYSYTFDKEWSAPLIIFNDGKNQSNGTLEPGDTVIADKIYMVE